MSRNIDAINRTLVHEQVRKGKLIPLMTDYQWLSVGLYALYPRTPHLPYRVRALLDFLVEVFGGEVPRWERGLELAG